MLDVHSVSKSLSLGKILVSINLYLVLIYALERYVNVVPKLFKWLDLMSNYPTLRRKCKDRFGKTNQLRFIVVKIGWLKVLE